MMIIILALITTCLAEVPRYGPVSHVPGAVLKTGESSGLSQGYFQLVVDPVPLPQHNVNVNANSDVARTIITKDIFVHAPPPETPEELAGGLDGTQIKHKRFKILFIKAPSLNIEQELKVKQAANAEEKTIIYVLSKKPDISTELEAARTKIAHKNKPEVFFIKYKTKGNADATNQAASGPSILSNQLVSDYAAKSATYNSRGIDARSNEQSNSGVSNVLNAAIAGLVSQGKLGGVNNQVKHFEQNNALNLDAQQNNAGTGFSAENTNSVRGNSFANAGVSNALKAAIVNIAARPQPNSISQNQFSVNPGHSTVSGSVSQGITNTGVGAPATPTESSYGGNLQGKSVYTTVNSVGSGLNSHSNSAVFAPIAASLVAHAQQNRAFSTPQSTFGGTAQANTISGQLNQGQQNIVSNAPVSASQSAFTKNSAIISETPSAPTPNVYRGNQASLSGSNALGAAIGSVLAQLQYSKTNTNVPSISTAQGNVHSTGSSGIVTQGQPTQTQFRGDLPSNLPGTSALIPTIVGVVAQKYQNNLYENTYSQHQPPPPAQQNINNHALTLISTLAAQPRQGNINSSRIVFPSDAQNKKK